MAVAMLIDLTRCRGCKACVFACKEQNGLPPTEPDRLSPHTWTAVENRSGVFVRRQCMHCLDPACVSVCPVGALQKTGDGPVTYYEERCIGCRYCMMACPFQIPTYEWSKALPRVQKCIFCAEKRLSKNQQPACTEVCPYGASTFGDRDQLIREARGRIEADKNRYVNHVYGIEEAGGTSVLYLSAVPFEKLGLPEGLEREPYPRLTWDILSKLPNIASAGSVLMFGVWWIVNRRMKLQQIEQASDHASDAKGQERGGR